MCHRPSVEWRKGVSVLCALDNAHMGLLTHTLHTPLHQLALPFTVSLDDYNSNINKRALQVYLWNVNQEAGAWTTLNPAPPAIQVQYNNNTTALCTHRTRPRHTDTSE